MLLHRTVRCSILRLGGGKDRTVSRDWLRPSLKSQRFRFESLEKFGVAVSYWRDETPQARGSSAALLLSQKGKLPRAFVPDESPILTPPPAQGRGTV